MFHVEHLALRIVDANLNRAREALRTVEDYARFVLDDAELQKSLKSIRHDLTAATREVGERAALWRDTPGDVGTRATTAAEATRANLADVVLAAGSRFGEALRTLEETLKTHHSPTAAVLETLRYRYYHAEQTLRRTLSPTSRFAGVRLYLILTESACRGDWKQVAEEALATNQVEAIQLREPDLPAGELFNRAKLLREMTRDYKTLLMINDRPAVAVLANADGAHVGQTDLPAAEVRKLVGPRMIVGVSTHEVEQVRQARRDGATYVGVGPVYPSATKPRDIAPGLPFARAAAALDLLPTVAIAGITPARSAAVWSTGVTAIAVASAITMADDIPAAIAGLRPPA